MLISKSKCSNIMSKNKSRISRFVKANNNNSIRERLPADIRVLLRGTKDFQNHMFPFLKMDVSQNLAKNIITLSN